MFKWLCCSSAFGTDVLSVKVSNYCVFFSLRFVAQKYPDDIKEIFSLLSNITFPKWLMEKQHETGMSELEDLTGLLLDEAK